jgi:type IV pilus assembly protein PilM
METHQVAWGLDIGHASIKAIKLARSGTGVAVLGYAVEPVHVAEDGDRDAAVLAALGNIAQGEDFGATPVFCALSGRQVYTKTVNIPVINPKKMDKMVELEARQQIPGNFDEIEWGYHPSPAADGQSIDAALFAVKRDVIENLIARCKSVGINLAGISVPSLALYNFVRYDQDFPADEAVLILDVGAENTDLVCYKGDQLWMRNLSVSGNDITQAFAKKFRVSVEEAERLKRQVTDSRQADRIIKVIEGGLGDLVSEVNRSIGFYRNQNADAKLDNLVISGNTFRLPGLPEYLADKLRLTVNILEDLDKIDVAPGLDRSNFMNDLQSLGVALGLALQATGAARANVNLMPNQVQAERLLKTKRWAAVAAIAIVGASLWLDYNMVDEIRTTNLSLAERVEGYATANQKRSAESDSALRTVQEVAPALQKFDALGAGQGLVNAALEGTITAIQELATTPSLTPPVPEDATGQAPPLAGVYLRSIELAASPRNAPFQPLAPGENRIVTVLVDIPASPHQAEIRSRLLRRLGEIAVPAYLPLLGPAASDDKAAPRRLFSDVQATSDEKGSLFWSFINPSNLDDQGNLKPLKTEHKIEVSTTTFVCTLARPANEAAAPEAQP